MKTVPKTTTKHNPKEVSHEKVNKTWPSQQESVRSKQNSRRTLSE